MSSIKPISIKDVFWSNSSYLRSTLVQLWDEMFLFVAYSAIIALVALLLFFPPLLNRYALMAALIPLLILIPAWVAYCYQFGRLSTGYDVQFGDYFRAFAYYYRRSCLLSAPFAILLFAVLTSLPLLSTSPPFLVMVGIMFQIGCLLTVCLLMIHALPTLALFDLPLRQVWLRSILLAARKPLPTLALLSYAFMLVTIALIIPLLWLTVPYFFIPFQVNATLLISKRIIDSEEEAQK